MSTTLYVKQNESTTSICAWDCSNRIRIQNHTTHSNGAFCTKSFLSKSASVVHLLWVSASKAVTSFCTAHVFRKHSIVGVLVFCRRIFVLCASCFASDLFFLKLRLLLVLYYCNTRHWAILTSWSGLYSTPIFPSVFIRLHCFLSKITSLYHLLLRLWTVIDRKSRYRLSCLSVSSALRTQIAPVLFIVFLPTARLRSYCERRVLRFMVSAVKYGII